MVDCRFCQSRLGRKVRSLFIHLLVLFFGFTAVKFVTKSARDLFEFVVFKDFVLKISFVIVINLQSVFCTLYAEFLSLLQTLEKNSLRQQSVTKFDGRRRTFRNKITTTRKAVTEMKQFLTDTKNFLAILVEEYLIITQRLSGCHI